MGMGFGSKEARAVQFAKDLHDRWGVGDVTCQNGIVLAIAIEDRAIGISTGAGVKHVLTDDMVRYIISEIRPYMKMKEYGKAIVQAVTIIGNVISGWKPETSKSLHLGSAFFFVVAASSVSFLLISSARSKHRYSKCKRILSSIDEGRKAASRNAYVAKSCPICLEDFSADPSKDSVTQLPSSSLTLHKDADVQTTVPLRTTAGNAQSLFSKTSTASNAAEEEIALPCGHKYHEKCIMSWLSGPGKTNSQCPICRQPVSKDNDDEIENRTNSSQPSGWDVYDPEYSFRMRRTHYYFPDFITWNMINSWHHDRHAESLSMAASHSFSAVDPTVVANAARSAGTGGSSFSFGGGSSAGGGGGGGSW